MECVRVAVGREDRKRVAKEWGNRRLIGIFYSQIYAELCTTTVVRDQYDVPSDTASLLWPPITLRFGRHEASHQELNICFPVLVPVP